MKHSAPSSIFSKFYYGRNKNHEVSLNITVIMGVLAAFLILILPVILKYQLAAQVVKYEMNERYHDLRLEFDKIKFFINKYEKFIADKGHDVASSRTDLIAYELQLLPFIQSIGIWTPSFGAKYHMGKSDELALYLEDIENTKTSRLPALLLDHVWYQNDHAKKSSIFYDMRLSPSKVGGYHAAVRNTFLRSFHSGKAAVSPVMLLSDQRQQMQRFFLVTLPITKFDKPYMFLSVMVDAQALLRQIKPLKDGVIKMKAEHADHPGQKTTLSYHQNQNTMTDSGIWGFLRMQNITDILHFIDRDFEIVMTQSMPHFDSFLGILAISVLLALSILYITIRNYAAMKNNLICNNEAWVAEKKRYSQQDADLHAVNRSLNHLMEITSAVPFCVDLRTYSFTRIGQNIEQLSGYSAIHWMQEGYWSQHCHPEDRHILHDLVASSQSNYNVSREYKIKKSDGSTVWIKAVILPSAASSNGDANTHEMQGFLVDVSELHCAYEEIDTAREMAERAHHHESEFVAIMTHELRTPLNSIIGFSEIMSKQAFGPIGKPQYLEYVNNIHTAGVHLLSLINDILDLSKMEARQLDMIEEDFNLSELFKTCHMLIAQKAEEGGVRLNINLPSPAPIIYGDNRRIKQILLNLLSNAVKFTPEGGSVFLSCHMHFDGSLEMAVRDTGIGIKKEDINKALSKFQQVESTLSRKHSGTGLGLPITKSLVKMHKGRFIFESEFGQGTIAKVILPANRISNRSKLPRGEDGFLSGVA